MSYLKSFTLNLKTGVFGILSFGMCCNSGLSQVIDTKGYDEKYSCVITPFVEVYKSKIQLPIDSVAASKSARFSKLENKAFINSGYDPYFYWFRFILKNDALNEKPLVLYMGPTGVSEAELFQKTNGQWVSRGKTGHRYQFAERPYQYAHYAFPLVVAPSTNDTFYLSMDMSHVFKTYGFALLHPKAAKINENKVYFKFGIITGLLLLFSVINLYSYFANREKVHLWYSFYILILLAFVLNYDLFHLEFLGMNSEELFRIIPLISNAAIGIGILVHVVQLFLRNINHQTILYKMTRFIKYNLILSAIVHFIVYNAKPSVEIESTIFKWVDWSTMLAIVMIIFNCIYSFLNGFKTALVILSGLVVFLICAFGRLLLLSNASILFPPSMLHRGILLEVLIISFGLIYRHNKDRKEKLKFEREKEILFVKQGLEAQVAVREQTLNNISIFLHGNITQSLALAQIYVNTIELIEPEEKIKEKINKASQSIRTVGDKLGKLAHILNSDYVGNKGLQKSIQHLLDILDGIYKTSLLISGQPFEIEVEKEVMLFRICQDAFNNILKHASANNISVSMRFESQKLLIIEIKDNGKGFLVDGAVQGLGMINMVKHGKSINTDVLFFSEPKKGTTVKLIFANMKSETNKTRVSERKLLRRILLGKKA